MAILRNELKFYLHSADALLLKQRLGAVLSTDRHTKPGSPYHIRSLYFDDPNFTAYFDKINSLEKREKFRIRYYNEDLHFIRLEKKQKFGKFCRKEWEEIPLALAEKALSYPPFLSEPIGALSEEFFQKIRSCGLAPCFFVDYQRTAFVSPMEDVRITIDENLKALKFSSSLSEKSPLSIPALEEGESILEIKFNRFLPTHLIPLWEGIPMIQSSVSKFTKCAEVLY